MENNQVKKKGNGLAIVSIIISVILLTLCILLFTGVISSPFAKDDTNNAVKSTTKDDTKNSTTVNTDTKEKSADERYKDYINNLSSQIDAKYKEFDEASHEGFENYSSYDDELVGGYSVKINSKKELIITGLSGKYNNQKIADNVVSFYRVHVGNGSNYALYYITTEGKVYYVDFYNELSIKEETRVKNIVEVKKGNGGMASFTMFIDIDGNIFTPGVAE